MATPVNDHPTLTHEDILTAIRTDKTGDRLRAMAREARTVDANGLADQLDGFADDRSHAR